MKTHLFLYFIFIILLIHLTNCNSIPDGFDVFETFDEYSLKGVKSHRYLDYPFVAVSVQQETISVIIKNNIKKCEYFEYIDMGEYWYNFRKEQSGYIPHVLLDTTPRFYERYIFNDTIMIHSYMIDRNKNRIIERLEFKTRSEDLCLFMKQPFLSNSIDKFNQLKKYITFYRDSFEIDKKTYQPKFYTHYSKKLTIDSILYFQVSDNERHKAGSIAYSKKISRLREFGLREYE